MIISSSRRTDIPAFYTPWFMNRIREGFCTVVNPMNAKQVYRVSLRPQDVDAIVFWTKNPRPMMPHLKKLDDDYNYYFYYTVNHYPQVFEPNLPSIEERLQSFRELSGMIGADRVIWRFDPIMVTSITDYSYIREHFSHVASSLEGYTKKVVISYVDNYRAAQRRFRRLQDKGLRIETNPGNNDDFWEMILHIRKTAAKHGMEVESCAENFVKYSIRLGKCIDDELIYRLFDRKVCSKKDPGQRKECNCVVSKDIGFYDSCLHNCIYCYATHCEKKRLYHDENSPSLLGRFDVVTAEIKEQKPKHVLAPIVSNDLEFETESFELEKVHS